VTKKTHILGAFIYVYINTYIHLVSLLALWVRIPPGHGRLSVMSVVFCQVEVSRPEESYRMWCV
jgi:hypothetical protein